MRKSLAAASAAAAVLLLTGTTGPVGPTASAAESEFRLDIFNGYVENNGQVIVTGFYRCPGRLSQEPVVLDAEMLINNEWTRVDPRGVSKLWCDGRNHGWSFTPTDIDRNGVAGKDVEIKATMTNYLYGEPKELASTQKTLNFNDPRND
ncbi:hypothetical protein [Streptomyces sp. SID3343]|uniref:hypothetical protein n=1 Tax=Streptomyces sp. SID3343 TaxID=2690260 RepID=UPI0013703446|nr:hypothetical protein [Streptomyces sp. SID3343]MYW04802.1 hypothetical protein [Streptomyces sp. SID3343]